MKAWEAAGRPGSGSRPGEGEVIGRNRLDDPVERYSSDSPMVGSTGDIEAMVMYAGQGVEIVRDVRPAGEIVGEIAADALKAINRARLTFG